MKHSTAARLAALAALLVTATACSSGSSGSPSAASGSGSSSAGTTSSAPQKTVHVKFGYIGDFNGSSLLAIANKQGMWKEHGVDATLSVFTNGPLQIQALGTGNLDFGYIGPGAMWLPASGKAKVIAINTLGGADRVIAQPGITSLADLKGKTIGVPQGTSGDMILTLALQKAKLSKSDVKIVTMDPSTIPAAFISKKIDAAGFWYPATATIKKQVPDLVELAKDSDFSATVAFPTAYVASNDMVSKNPDTTKRVLAVLREAIAYRSAHLDEAIADTASMLKLDVAAVKADAALSQVLPLTELDKDTQDGTIAKWLTGMESYFIGAGELTKANAEQPSQFYTGDQFVAAGQ